MKINNTESAGTMGNDRLPKDKISFTKSLAITELRQQPKEDTFEKVTIEVNKIGK